MSAQIALRVVVEGPVTSFRYPYFIQGVQPTYDIPPPATLYGHVCSALGDLLPPDSFRLALHFTFATRFYDYEHIHLFGRESKLSPFQRELLFHPRLTLYLDRPDWLEAFRQPRYVVTLGRSQDLMTYREVRVVELQAQDSAYVEHTLLPLETARTSLSLSALALPRYVSPRRRVRWAQYAHIRQPQAWDQPSWVDPEAQHWRGRGRAVYWLDFGGESE